MSPAGSPVRPRVRSSVRRSSTVGAPPPAGTVTSVTSMLIRSALSTGTVLEDGGADGPGGPEVPGSPCGPCGPGAPSSPSHPHIRNAENRMTARRLAVLLMPFIATVPYAALSGTRTRANYWFGASFLTDGYCRFHTGIYL